MLNLKYFLVLSVIFILGTVQAKATGEILRDANGDIRNMWHDQASGRNLKTNQKEKADACERVGKGHLPTIRELAKESQARGAKGILEVSQVNPKKIPAGYRFVSAIDPDGKKDEFYFNGKGYKHREGDLGDNWFWSSSIVSESYAFAYVLVGHDGDVYSSMRYIDYYDLPDKGYNVGPEVSVLCVSDR